MGYIEDILNNDVRTEGMSYGMMIAVQLDKKTEFDRLWKGRRLTCNTAADHERTFSHGIVIQADRFSTQMPLPMVKSGS